MAPPVRAGRQCLVCDVFMTSSAFQNTFHWLERFLAVPGTLPVRGPRTGTMAYCWPTCMNARCYLLALSYGHHRQLLELRDLGGRQLREAAAVVCNTNIAELENGLSFREMYTCGSMFRRSL